MEMNPSFWDIFRQSRQLRPGVSLISASFFGSYSVSEFMRADIDQMCGGRNSREVICASPRRSIFDIIITRHVLGKNCDLIRRVLGEQQRRSEARHARSVV